MKFYVIISNVYLEYKMYKILKEIGEIEKNIY